MAFPAESCTKAMTMGSLPESQTKAMAMVLPPRKEANRGLP